MEPALVPVFVGRPAIVKVRGADVYLSLHDASYFRERADWKRRLFVAHPDRGGSESNVREVLRGVRRWRKAEQKWYAAVGYPLPGTSVIPSPVTSEQPARGTPNWERCARARRERRELARRAAALVIELKSARLAAAQLGVDCESMCRWLMEIGVSITALLPRVAA